MARSIKSPLAGQALIPKVYTLTYPSPYESAPNTALPTSEPGTRQFSRAVVSGDLPTFSPGLIHGCKYTAVVVFSLSNPSGSATWSKFRIWWKGNLIVDNTGAYIPAGAYLTEGHYRFYDVAVGDTFEAAFWNEGGVGDLEFLGFYILPTQIQVEPSGTPLLNVKLTTVLGPTFTVGPNPSAYETLPIRYQGLFSKSSGSGFLSESTAITKKMSAMPLMNTGICWVYEGDVSLSSYYTDSVSECPRYKRYARLTEISYYKVGGLPK